MIYFDNSATTFPKPPSVINEVVHCMTEYCGNAGRSGHTLSIKASEKIYECREEIAGLFAINNPTNVVFTSNTTYAINIALNAFLKRKTHILISDVEHNSVYRAVCSLLKYGINYDVFQTFHNDTEKTLNSIKSKIKHNTSLIICTHTSNICGLTLPIYNIGKLCRQYEIKFIVDGAQSVGTHNININECNIDALCAPGHKGLYGPQGTGFVVFNDKYSTEKTISRLAPFIYGGNGFNSADKNMPDILPEKYEGGTLNTPGIAGLCEGIKFVKSQGEEKIFNDISLLYSRAYDIVSSIPNTTIYCGEIKKSCCLLFNVNDVPCDTVADMLNDDNICVRAGLHCSPLAHKKLNTQNGAVRASFSCFNNISELDIFYKSLKRIAMM